MEASPVFTALRAAILAIDDLCRQRVRGWMLEAIDFRGTMREGAAPDDRLLQFFAAGLSVVPEEERRAYRQWVVRWTDWTGRIISPSEHAARIERARRDVKLK